MKTTHVISSFIIVLVAWIAPARHAHAQGLMQITYDRDAWPTAEAQRTIVLPLGLTQIQLNADYVSGESYSTYRFRPVGAYGVTPNISIGASYSPAVTSFTSDLDGSNTTTTDTTLSAGSVFAIARPFNSYDIGIRAEIPFNVDASVVDLDLELVGRLTLSLDTVSWFFSAGVTAELYNGNTPPPDEFEDTPSTTFFVGDTYFVFQLNPLFSLSPGLSFLLNGDNSGISLYGRAQYSITPQVDVFGKLGVSTIDHGDNTTFLTAGVNIWL